MALVKVSEASGIVLDWLVAQCEGYTNLRRNVHRFNNDWLVDSPNNQYGPLRLTALNYSTNPNLAWPIIEREGINLRAIRKEGHNLDGQALAAYDHGNTGSMVQWVRRLDWPKHYSIGPTMLIAAMRCYVASKLGNVVEVPEELLKG